MKKIILGLAISIALASCSNNESKMKSEILVYLDKNAKDPKSYELVELKILDTVTAGEVATQLKKLNDSFIKEYTQEIEGLKKIKSKNEFYNKKFNSHDFDDLIKENINDINSDMSMIKESQEDNIKLQKLLKSADIIGYMVHHKYRLKNGFGALDLSESDVLFNKDFKLESFDASNKDENYLFRKMYLK